MLSWYETALPFTARTCRKRLLPVIGCAAGPESSATPYVWPAVAPM